MQPDIVFLVTRHDDRYARRGENCYLMGKATLANVALPSQAVTIETLRQPDNSWQWSVQSVALQTYAKVGNIPFVLHDAVGIRELVIGVGRSDLVDPQQGYVRQIFGAAACFRQDGDFLYAGSTVPVAGHDDYEEMLAELLANFIERFEREQGSLERLVLHIFKRTGRRELSAVERALAGRDIPFALLHVNRDTPLWLVTEDAARHQPAAPGAQVAFADYDRLLMTGDVNRRRRNAHPLRLTLDRNSTFRDMDRLATQIQGFTATSWRGFHRTNEPSTILYGRLLAEKVTQLVPYGFRPEVAVAMGDRPGSSDRPARETGEPTGARRPARGLPGRCHAPAGARRLAARSLVRARVPGPGRARRPCGARAPSAGAARRRGVHRRAVGG